MPKPVAPIAIALALITGAWFGQAYTLFASVAPVQAEDTVAMAAVNTVWRFYDAIDILLRTADASALLAVIAPDFIDHVDEPSSPSDRDGLVGYLTSLRATHPELRLVPQEVVARGDQVVARLASTDRVRGEILGIPLLGTAPWPRVDLLRVQDGRIVERWGDPAGYAPSTVRSSETLTFPYPGDRVPVLRRVTVAPGVRDATIAQAAATIVTIESGEVEITTATADVTATEPGTDSTPARVQTRDLTVGDTLTIADGVDVIVANRTTSPAVLLALTLSSPMPEGLYARGEGSAYALVNGTEGVSIEDLAGGISVTATRGRLSIELARVNLAPGGRLASHPVTGMEIVVVEGGTVAASMDGDNISAWLRDPQGHYSTPPRYAQISAGYSLVVKSGTSTTYANETTQAVTLLLLTVTPE